MLRALVAAMLTFGVTGGVVDEKSAPELKGAAAMKSIHEFTVKDIDGNDVSLAKYKGSVCLIVNVASK